MNEILSLQQKIVPELIELLEKRYTILQNLNNLEPIGRRGLASRLRFPERLIRKEIDFLKAQGLILVNSNGIWITEQGKELINSLEGIVHEMRGLSDLEQILQKELGIAQVLVVPGDSDQNDLVKKDIGRVAARYLQAQLQKTTIWAITGGSTTLEIAEAMPQKTVANNLTIVPARGGLGEDVEMQANTISAKLAKKIGANYKLLYVPENLEEEAVKTLLHDPKIRQSVDLIQKANILIHGIGQAEQMARRREVDEKQLQKLLEKGAIGEAFGYYFNSDGEIIYSTSSIGIGFESLDNINHIVAVAGGSHKARAILAVVSKGYHDVLITDEGAAIKMVDTLHIK